MEAFSLLKYWRAAAGGGATTTTSSSAATTILTAATPSSSSSSSDSGNDDGPFFDLEFTVPDEDDGDESSDSDDQTELPGNVGGDIEEPAGIPEETAPKFPVASILKSANKFRVQMRKFNKPKSGNSRQKEKVKVAEKKSGSKLLTVKLKVEEAVPLVSVLFSNRASETPKVASKKTTVAGEDAGTENSSIAEDGEEERKFAKEIMSKYLKKVKPLYVRASKRYGDKLRLSTPPQTAAEDAEKPAATPPEEVAEEAPAAGKVLKQGNIQAGFRVVCKHLGKSRSASSAAAPPSAGAETTSSRRRDDSLLQQQDGIQSAIMHCKRSFNASRDSASSILSRSVR